MPITEEQRERVIAISEGGDPNEVDSFLASASEPEELHAFVEHWNYDYGTDNLIRVMDHPVCDLATALMAFWRGGPSYYLQYDRCEDVPPYEREGYDFAKTAEGRIIDRSDWRSGIAFDPAADDGIDWTREYESEAGGNRLTESLYQPAPIAAGTTGDTASAKS